MWISAAHLSSCKVSQWKICALIWKSWHRNLAITKWCYFSLVKQTTIVGKFFSATMSFAGGCLITLGLSGSETFYFVRFLGRPRACFNLHELCISHEGQHRNGCWFDIVVTEHALPVDKQCSCWSIAEAQCWRDDTCQDREGDTFWMRILLAFSGWSYKPEIIYFEACPIAPWNLCMFLVTAQGLRPS